MKVFVQFRIFEFQIFVQTMDEVLMGNAIILVDNPVLRVEGFPGQIFIALDE